MFSNTVLALPTTAVLPTHTGSVWEVECNGTHALQNLSCSCNSCIFFGLMFLSPKNAKLVVVHTNLRGDSLAVVYYTELPRENSITRRESKNKGPPLPAVLRYRDVCVCAPCGNSIGALRRFVLWFIERPLWLSGNVWNVTKEVLRPNEGPQLPSRKPR